MRPMPPAANELGGAQVHRVPAAAPAARGRR
jgi:hypothetical protein